jgi:hypothetical protein
MSSRHNIRIGIDSDAPLPITEGRLLSMMPLVVMRAFARLVYKDNVERIVFVDQLVVGVLKGDKFDFRVFTYKFALAIVGVFVDAYNNSMKNEETGQKREQSIAVLMSVMFKSIEGNLTLQPEVSCPREFAAVSNDAARLVTGLMIAHQKPGAAFTAMSESVKV